MVQYNTDDNGNVKIEFNYDEQIEYENLDPFLLLQPREIGITIAYQIFDREEIREKDIDYEINDFFSKLHEEIYENVLNTLEDNGIQVI